ncbi:hypothetical protein QBC35DRAFT_438718 [Podospora australis]|uniref:Uncharacterized protein n=1 Tax=Podospora australis TaxID=1536484 RepID=A0AAN6WSS9_9PEZI|nr:hypothetical protein QBC35DRAFT_438718 [Podospora australis]
MEISFTGFHPEPNCGRGTLTILYTSLITIFLSSWAALHLETPRPDLKKRAAKVSHLTSKIFDCLISIISPDYSAADRISATFRALRLRSALRQIPGSWESFSLQQAFLVHNDGCRHVTPLNILPLAQSKRLAFKDFPSDEEIADRSKADKVVKLITISQCIWFGINTLYRLSRNYRTSPFEVFALGHAVSGIISLAAMLSCPQDIRIPFDISTGDEDEDNDAEEEEMVFGWGVVLANLLLTALLLAGTWWYPFPSTEEMWLWRGFALSGPVPVIVFYLSDATGASEKSHYLVHNIVYVLLLVVLICSRLGIIVLALMAFRRAPLDLYTKPDLSDYWPHF